jgi:hypothetical protein
MPDQPVVTDSAARNWVSAHCWSSRDRNSLSRRRLAVDDLGGFAEIELAWCRGNSEPAAVPAADDRCVPVVDLDRRCSRQASYAARAVTAGLGTCPDHCQPWCAVAVGAVGERRQWQASAQPLQRDSGEDGQPLLRGGVELGWTDAAPVDPFVVVADGRCPFNSSGVICLTVSQFSGQMVGHVPGGGGAGHGAGGVGSGCSTSSTTRGQLCRFRQFGWPAADIGDA